MTPADRRNNVLSPEHVKKGGAGGGGAGKKLYLLPAAGKRTGGNHAVDVGFNGGGKNA